MNQTQFRSWSSFQRGVGLVELLIAMTLTLVLTLGVVQVYVANKETFRLSDSLARIQENSRFAVDILSKEIRMAAYRGCMSKTPVALTNTLNNSTQMAWNFESGIQGFNDVGSTLPSGLVGHFAAADPAPLAGTDVLVIRGPTGGDVRVVANNNSAQLFAENVSSTVVCANGSNSISGLCEGDVVMVSDCQKARVFQISNLTRTAGGAEVNVVHSNSSMSPGNASSSWGGASAPANENFGPDSQIIRMQTIAYYVAEEPGTGIPSLYRKVNNQPAALLVEGVADIQLAYGVDTSEDFRIDEYRDASTVADWEKVLSVQADLLMTSVEDNVVDESQTFQFAGEEFNASDRRLYQVVSSTSVLRNRVP